MNRRKFIRNGVILGSTAAAVPAIGSCSQPDNQPRVKSIDVPDIELLETLENSFLKVRIFNNAVIDVVDKKNNIAWTTGKVAIQEDGQIEEGHVWLRTDRSMCEQFSGRFILRKISGGFRITLFGRQDVYKGEFNCSFSLENEWLRIRISDISEEIQSLVFPPPFQCNQLVIPKGIGELRSGKESGAIYTRYLYTFFTHLNMKWFGGVQEDGAWMCIYEKGFEDGVAMVANNTVSPGYTRTLGEWTHPFELKYGFIKGDYVGLAKKYRNHVIENGEFKSLSEKAALNPDLKKMYGGRAFWYTLAMGHPRDRDSEDMLLTPEQLEKRGRGEGVHIYNTFREAGEVIKHIGSLGMKKGFFKIAGWIQKGYDWSHPDIWPPEPGLGSVDELKELMNLGGKALTGLHDNYMDMYEGLPSWPEGVIRQKDGSLMTGGSWAGGQAYIMNYKAGLDYARRNWEKIKELAPRAVFVDTTTAVQLYQSYEKGLNYTKADDHFYKKELIKFYIEQGVLFGSEEVADFAIPDIHWYECRHRRTEGVSIPLWPLVFHDAALLTRYNGRSPGDTYPAWMEDMLWGYMMHFNIRNGKVDEEYFRESLHVDDWHAEIAEAEMITHRFLKDDFKVEMTEFSNGKSIICNFGKDDFGWEGKSIKGGEYKIL